MRNSYFTTHLGPYVVLLKDIAEQLNIGYKSVLYAIASEDPIDRPVAYVSSIPVASWPNAYRLVVYTASPPGSLHAVTKCFGEMGLNQLAAWAGGISANGELCMTAVVEIPVPHQVRGNDGRGATDPERTATALEKKILGVLRAKDCLSSSSLFSGDSSLRPVRCVPLRVLQRLHAQHVRGRADCEYVLRVRQWEFSLADGVSDDRASLYERLCEANVGKESLGEVVLMTPDTEERYFVLALLHSKDIKKLRIPIEARSKDGNFTGLFEDALDTLNQAHLNVYSARNIVESKEQPVENESLHVERAVFELHVDTSRASVRRESPGLLGHVTRGIETRFHAHQNVNAARVLEKSAFVSGIHGSETLVFLATNAKPEMPESYKSYALELIRELQALGLHPVNVDVTKSRVSVMEEITGLLDACPVLVSLYLPEEGSLLQHGVRKAKARPSSRPTAKNQYAPSDYTMFEESYMLAKKHFVLRMRHEAVFGPRYGLGRLEKVFGQRTFKPRLAKLVQQLQRIFRDTDWHKLVFTCSMQRRGVYDDIVTRDLPGWLRGKSN